MYKQVPKLVQKSIRNWNPNMKWKSAKFQKNVVRNMSKRLVVVMDKYISLEKNGDLSQITVSSRHALDRI